MNSKLFKLWPALLLTVIILFFFAPILSKETFFATPDYGRSDYFHFFMPTKYALFDALKNQSLPLWQTNIGQGFPLFDEGQTGILYLPNLILFALLPFTYAFNLGYVVTFLMASFGTYLFARSLNLNKPASLLGAVTYAFCPVFTLHLHHYTLIQTAAYLPWYLFLINSFFKTRKLIYPTLLPFFMQQQVFAGFPQFVAYSLLGSGAFTIFMLTQLKKWKQRIKISVILAAFIILGLAASSIQLAATSRLVKQSQRISRLTSDSILRDFPFKPKNLQTALNPYIHGNPKQGTYPAWQPGIWGIFWENNMYFGVIQLALVISLIYILARPKVFEGKKSAVFFLALGAFGIIMALGKYAPLHPLFAIPPFSVFRVPSRLLILTFMSFSIISAFVANRMYKMLAILIFTIAVFDIFRVWQDYSMLAPAQKWLEKPPLAQKVKPAQRIVAVDQEKMWNDIFLEKGWAGQQEQYYFFRNFLAHNSNIFWDLDSLHVYGGITPRRTQIIEGLSKFDIKEENGAYTAGPISRKIFSFSNTRYLTSSLPFNQQGINELDKVTNGDKTIYLSENTSSQNRVFALQNYQKVKTIEDLQNKLQSEDFDPAQSVLLEEDPPFTKPQEAQVNRLEITKYENQDVEIAADLTGEHIVVLSDSYYPNWHAYIDGSETKIFAANVNSRAIVVPSGIHTISFKYQLDSLKLWLYISTAATIAGLIIAIGTRKTTVQI